jgi:FAD/FMN-containing dehydrogenase
MHPITSTAHAIETIALSGKNSSNLFFKGGCIILSRAISLTVFPLLLSTGLVFKRIPKLIWVVRRPEKRTRQMNKVIKFILGIISTPLLSWKAPEGVPGRFVKTARSGSEVRPFGVEEIYGKSNVEIATPATDQELIDVVKRAKREGKQIAILGAGMSQGTQTVPTGSNHILIDMRCFNSRDLDADRTAVVVGAGATWEEVQTYLDAHGKSIIVKQASNPFSIGGSIGINCHGWAHEYGAIASTFESLTILDASGEIQTVYPGDDPFRCMFGTLGYFGIVVRAKLRIVDNYKVVQRTDKVSIDQFASYYERNIKGHPNIPLCGGRLSLDSLDGHPLQEIQLVRYETVEGSAAAPTPNFSVEPLQGSLIERLGLRFFAHLSNFSVKYLTHWFWEKEKAAMHQRIEMTRNEALHPPINSFFSLHDSILQAQWLQEYFVTAEELPAFLRFLGKTLHDNDVRLINATIRPTPKDEISILPYAEKDRYAVVICFAQEKSKPQIAKTKAWIRSVQEYLTEHDGVYYQAYMPYATKREFHKCYGIDRVARMRALKAELDPTHLFGNAHTAKYFDETVPSHYRTVFQSSRAQKKAFVNFLCTIFYQLDEKKVFAEMEKILANSRLTDKEIYEELVARMPKMKKSFRALLQIKALNILKKGMGLQAKTLLKDFDKSRIHNYMEIYDRRYLSVLRNIAGLPLDGRTIGMTDTPTTGLLDRVQAGSLLSRYPYKESIPLRNYAPIEEDMALDLIACLGGLHHIPQELVGPFLDSLHQKLRPGAPLLLRDHDVTSPKMNALVSVVHSFVNAADGVPYREEEGEVREFKTAAEWTDIMGAHGFVKVSGDDGLVLQHDPTANGMMAFVKAPRTLEELREAATYRANAIRPIDGTKATWLEWGNVRFSKAYAEFIQTHHAYEFDYLGHMRQHVTHFREYLKGRSFTQILKADNLSMNLFILTTTIVQCSLSYLMAIPSKLIARCFGATDLTRLERYEAALEDAYSTFIDATPFYQFPYISKIKGLWQATQWFNVVSALSSTVSLLAKALISSPIRFFYSSEANIEPNTTSMIIYDPTNAVTDTGTEKVIYATPDGYKLLSCERYMPFTAFCKRIATLPQVQIVEIGGRSEVSVDLLLPEGNPGPQGHTPVYTLPKLQDPQHRTYATYLLDTTRLRNLPQDQIQYIHE